MLLPPGARLLVAVSGGQDSMALLHLLGDLSRLHGWPLEVWHGDHGWSRRSTATALALSAWLDQAGWSLWTDRAAPGTAVGEAAARRWRYATLLARARQLDCSHVVTGHTASDRAETLLLNLIRGTHRRGLASLRPSRPLEERQLVRPLLLFNRRETASIARAEGLPVWADPSNNDLAYARNRLRREVLPILDSLHPGVEQRLAALAERLAQEEEEAAALTELALAALRRNDGSLRRQALSELGVACQRRLLQAWLEPSTGVKLKASILETLLCQLASPEASGTMDLAGGWRLHWQGDALTLASPPPSPAVDAP